MTPEIIGKISLGRTAELRFERSLFKGKNYINIRRFVESANFTGYTKKGVTLSPDIAQQLVNALNQYLQTSEANRNDEICRLTKNETTELIARTLPPDEKHDVTSIDIREYVQTENYTGWTQKGFRLHINEIDNIINFMNDCLRKIDVE